MITTYRLRPYTFAAAAAALIFSTLSHAAPAGDGWEQIKDKDGVQVYTRAVEGSDFLAIAASTVMQADSDKVAAALGTGDGCAEWRKMCKSSKILDETSADDRLVYMVLDLPWPLSDRDVVMRILTNIDTEAQTAVVSLNSDSQAYPAQKHVRAECNGQFVIKVLDENQVEVTYEMHADIGGDISPGMVKSRQVDSTFAEMVALRELVE